MRKTASQVKALIKAKKDPAPLLDTYGPGRVIFRNKRSGIKGFPKRKARLISLKGDSQQIRQINREYEDGQIIEGVRLLKVEGPDGRNLERLLA